MVVRCRWHHMSSLCLYRSMNCSRSSLVTKFGIDNRISVVQSVFKLEYLFLLVSDDVLLHFSKVIRALLSLWQVLVITLQVDVLVTDLAKLSRFSHQLLLHQMTVFAAKGTIILWLVLPILIMTEGGRISDRWFLDKTTFCNMIIGGHIGVINVNKSRRGPESDFLVTLVSRDGPWIVSYNRYGWLVNNRLLSPPRSLFLICMAYVEHS